MTPISPQRLRRLEGTALEIVRQIVSTLGFHTHLKSLPSVGERGSPLQMLSIHVREKTRPRGEEPTVPRKGGAVFMGAGQEAPSETSPTAHSTGPQVRRQV